MTTQTTKILALLLFSCLSCSATTYSLTADFGAIGDGSATNATVNRNAILTALTGSANTINVPGGTYIVDNSTMLAIVGFTGTLNCYPLAVFQLTNSAGSGGHADTYGGFYFSGGAGAHILGIHIVWPVPPGSVRDNLLYAALKIAFTDATVLTGAVVDGSMSAGIQFFACSNPVASHLRVSNSLADGVDFFNVQNASVANAYTINTGDDGLGFVRQGGAGIYDSWTGGSAQNITVINSAARGISVVGAANVSVTNFFVNNTVSSGILVDYESTFNAANQIPYGVSFTNGTISSAGGYGTTTANQFGIEIDIAPASVTVLAANIVLTNIKVFSSVGSGFSAYMSANLPFGSVTANDIRVSGNHDGFIFAVPSASLTNLVSDLNNYYGFYFSGVGTIVANGLTSINNSLLGSLNRALWIDSPTVSFSAVNVNVIDTQAVPTGFNIGQAFATGAVSGIQYNIPHGTLSVEQWGGSGMTFTAPLSNSALVAPSIIGYNAFNPPL